MKEIVEYTGIALLFFMASYLFGKFAMKGALRELDRYLLHKLNQYITKLKTKENGTEKEE
jgi:hypothetical protein